MWSPPALEKQQLGQGFATFPLMCRGLIIGDCIIATASGPLLFKCKTILREKQEDFVQGIQLLQQQGPCRHVSSLQVTEQVIPCHQLL